MARTTTKSGKKKEPVCLVPGCGQKATHRGMCPRCRWQAYRKVKAGLTSNDELISRGLLLPSQQGRRKSKLDLALAASK